MARHFTSEIQSRLAVLLVSPAEEDCVALRRIFPASEWHWDGVADIEGARLWMARSGPPPVVICNRDLRDGGWEQLLRETEALPHPPKLIVSSRLADEQLWVDVLNAGGHDVLPTPFDARETYRVVHSAAETWHRQWAVPGPRASRKAGASVLSMRSAC